MPFDVPEELLDLAMQHLAFDRAPTRDQVREHLVIQHALELAQAGKRPAGPEKSAAIGEQPKAPQVATAEQPQAPQGGKENGPTS